MRPIWKGTISFGMVTIPVKLYTATEDKDIRFRLLHRKDGSPIEEKRFCIKENKEVSWDELARGYEVSKGEYVILEPEEIEEAEPETAHTIEIGDFVELEEIDPIYFEKSYFLEPDGVGVKPFNLLSARSRRPGASRLRKSRFATRSDSRRSVSTTARWSSRRCTGPTRFGPPSSTSSESRRRSRSGRKR